LNILNIFFVFTFLTLFSVYFRLLFQVIIGVIFWVFSVIYLIRIPFFVIFYLSDYFAVALFCPRFAVIRGC